MKVDKGLKNYLKHKDYVLLTSYRNNIITLTHNKNKPIIFCEGTNSLLNAVDYAYNKNWHPVLIRIKK